MSEARSLAPVSVSERLEEVDLLRGWALLGILLVNMNFFSWPLFTIFLWGKPLRGENAELWRYRVGDYRVICQIQDWRVIVFVLQACHRKDVYR